MSLVTRIVLYRGLLTGGTALDAKASGFDAIVLRDASAVNVRPNDEESAIEELRRAGVRIADVPNLLYPEKNGGPGPTCSGKSVVAILEGSVRIRYVGRSTTACTSSRLSVARIVLSVLESQDAVWIRRARQVQHRYAGDWRGFCAFCARVGREPLPAEPETITRILLGALVESFTGVH